jgi:hypothetical protein
MLASPWLAISAFARTRTASSPTPAATAATKCSSPTGRQSGGADRLVQFCCDDHQSGQQVGRLNHGDQPRLAGEQASQLASSIRRPTNTFQLACEFGHRGECPTVAPSLRGHHGQVAR